MLPQGSAQFAVILLLFPARDGSHWYELAIAPELRSDMIRDINDLAAGSVLETEYVVVGGGIAGIDVARHLGRCGARVLLLESGRDGFDPETQKLARFESIGRQLREPRPDSTFTPYLAPHLRGEFRVRQFGGTSNIWTGKWRTFDSLDFKERSWVPFSGWPISREDLRQFYRDVARDYDLADPEEFAASATYQQARQELASAGLELSFHYWEKKAVRSAQKFRSELQASSTVEVLLGANVTEILLDSDLHRVSSVVATSLDGCTVSVRGQHFILCVGGLEGARLLLASNRQIPAGIGNANGLVGRFHMDHPKAKRGRLYPGPAMKRIRQWAQTQPRPRFHVSLSIADSLQERLRVLDHAIYLSPVYRYQVDYPYQVVDSLKTSFRRRDLIGVLRTAVRLAHPRALWKLLQRMWWRDLGGPVAWYAVSFYVEQAPNPESRLMLSESTDALGMPRLVVDWQLTDLDREAFPKILQGLIDACARAGLGRLDFGSESFTLEDTIDAAHHIGATRMSDDPARGVVDSNCRVFGTTNLFIVSSSVFPTGHSAAPTMTILAMGRRVAAHLLESHGGSQQRISHAVVAGDSAAIR